MHGRCLLEACRLKIQSVDCRVKITLMDEQTLQIIALFEREPLFMGLDDEQIADIAARFQVVHLPRNTVIFTQGSPPNAYYIIFDGHVRLMHFASGRESLLNVLDTGDYFGEQGLLFDRPRRYTASTRESTILLRLLPDQFVRLMQDYPVLYERLLITAESRSLAYSQNFKWLGMDEVIYFITRKSQFFLYTSLIVPIFIFITSFPVLAYAVYFGGSPTMNMLFIAIGFAMLVFGLGLSLWNWIDWSNDFYIITNQRVVWVEKLIGLYDSRREAPLDTILAVNVSTSLLGRTFGFGDVVVRTFTGGIHMRKMSKPYAFENIVRGYQKRVLVISAEEEKRTMERELEQAIRRKAANPFEVPVVEPLLRPNKPPNRQKAQTKDDDLGDFLKTFLKVRYEVNGVITYRKHWFLLLQKAWAPVLTLTLLVGSTLGVVWLEISRVEELISGFWVYLIGGFAYWLVLMWLAYYFWDWENDIYRLTPTQILDIERKPLGEELKKSAPLESILSIEHERENIIQNLLNFGYVTINIGQAKFIFRGVYNPDQVHQDISDYREILQRKNQAAEAAQERQRMINWLVTYYDQTSDPGIFENLDLSG